MTLDKLLISKGFSQSLSDNYYRLLCNQTINLKNIDKRALDTLVKLSMVTTLNERILLIDPKIVFSCWRNELKWLKERRNTRINNIISLFPKDLSLNDIDEIEQLISQSFKFSELSDHIIIGQDVSQITALICNAILSVKSELRAVAIDTELTNTSSIWGTIEPKLLTGMKYTRVCDINEILLHGVEIKKKDIKLGVNLLVLKKDSIKEKLYIFDEKSIFIFEALDEDNYSQSGQLINSEYIASIYIEKFNDYFNQSQPALNIINQLIEYYSVNSLSVEDQHLKQIYDSICAYGIFSEYQKAEPNKLQLLIDKELLISYSLKEDIYIFLPNIITFSLCWIN
ncbi:MAG: hypothetical protein M0Q21_08695 [Ignavibacteriaceae bacterium]|nr:hypothetical protein [Ignavibacteriaceae bacterium]